MHLTALPRRPVACALAILTLAVTSCATHPGSTRSALPGATPEVARHEPPPLTDAATLAALDGILAGPHRSDTNRARDAHRHPKETLAFFGIRADMTVMEVWPGGGGWYTEVLAPLLRDHGRYIDAGWDPAADNKFTQDGIRAYAAKLAASPDLYGKVVIAALQTPGAMSPAPTGSVDMVVSFRNLHNWMARDDAAPAMLKAIYAALKPGGILGIVDHRADPAAPADPKARLGYVNEQYAIELVKAAGFEFLGSSEVNANPKDTRDYEQGVWTLPPTSRLGDKDRARYAAIGESDRFTLKFRKPFAH